jgi:hypothetical protein
MAHLTDKIVLLQEENSIKRHYRVSDVILHKGHYWRESTEFVLAQPHLKDTILRAYLERCPDHNLTQINPDRLRLLHTIIQEKGADYPHPTPDELVIHLRAGDVVQFNWFLQKNYVKIIKQFIGAHHIKKVTFCTAFHYGQNITQNIFLFTPEKHQTNIEKMNDLFTRVVRRFPHLQVDVKSSADIDEDFVYMVMASHFVQDHGGFSILIQQLNDLVHDKVHDAVVRSSEE